MTETSYDLKYLNELKATTSVLPWECKAGVRAFSTPPKMVITFNTKADSVAFEEWRSLPLNLDGQNIQTAETLKAWHEVPVDVGHSPQIALL